MARLLFRLALGFADKIMVLNEENTRILIERKVARKEQVVLLEGGEGVDLERFRFSDNRSDKTIFLMVARVLYDKGYREVVEAARIVKRTHPEVEIQLLGPVDEAYPECRKVTSRSGGMRRAEPSRIWAIRPSRRNLWDDPVYYCYY